MISPGWISAVIAVIGVIVAIGGSWRLVQYRMEKIEGRQAAFESDQKGLGLAIANLKDALSAEMKENFATFRRMLFEEGGATRYLLRTDFDRSRGDCRADMLRRIDRLEQRAHDHPHGGPT
ncbi:MAG: hypothetical protein ACOWWM_12680 [Desulfobacterales bacterium]